MKKILIFHQSFPMGNYKLMPYMGKYLSDLGHEVYLLNQLNGNPASDEYKQIIKDHNFDSIYYEMVDKATFDLLSELKCNKVLCYCSHGIFGEKTGFDDILKYSGKLYNKVLTNSKEMSLKFNKVGAKSEHFEFYPAPLYEEEIIYDPKYNLDYVFLGGGFHRLLPERLEYPKEKEIIWFNPLVSKFGAGYPESLASYKGLLPPEDIGKLYKSAKFSLATIEPTQRSKGMVNNRFSEIMKSEGTILSIRYPEMDFYGAEEFITFVDDPDLTKYKDVKIDIKKQKEFIIQKEKLFFSKLTNLI